MGKYGNLTTALLLFIAAVARAETPRYNGVDPHAADYYQSEIAKNRQRNPQRAGESDTDYAIRMSHLDPNYTTPPTAQEDVAGMNGGTLDRAQKLTDAAAIALEGERAATAQAAEMVVAGITTGLDITGGGTFGDPAAAKAKLADSQKYFEAGTKYGQIKTDMQEARIQNSRGAARLKFDPEDGDGAGEPDPEKVASIVDGLSDKDKETLAARGIDPTELVERLLSGEVDTSDPAAILRELKDPTQLSVDDLNDVRALAEANTADTTLGADSAVRAGELAGKDLAEGRDLKDGEKLAGGDGISIKNFDNLKEKAISLVNRELIDRVGGWLGKGKGKKDGRNLASLDPKGLGPAKGKGVKKSLTAKAYYELQDNGITAPRFGNNIFKMAHRQYRDYGKWRENRPAPPARTSKVSKPSKKG